MFTAVPTSGVSAAVSLPEAVVEADPVAGVTTAGSASTVDAGVAGQAGSAFSAFCAIAAVASVVGFDAIFLRQPILMYSLRS